jgi:serine/threonine protein kinase
VAEPARRQNLAGYPPALDSRYARRMSSRQAGPGNASVGAVRENAADPNSATILSSVVTAPSGALALARICPDCAGRYPADFKVCPRDATPLVDRVALEGEDPLIGTTVGDTFRIVRLVGEGGMARVYEAHHVRLATKSFAIKVLNAAHAHQTEVVARFQREAEAASGIGHPNVADVYDVSRTPDGTPYLVSEFLRGTDFATLLKERGKLEVGLTVHVVRQVVRALGAAHARGIVHRDVKPENVFLVGDSDAPLVKVLDFGISKMGGPEGGSSTLTRTGMIMGTPGYMPPEQARGARVDHRADVYGVGAMLYRALTGQLPFDAEDPADALAAVLTEEPPRPRSIEPSIPEALELVIERAMAKEPGERYLSMAELDADLEAFVPESRAYSLLPAVPTTPTATRPSTGSSTAAPTLLTGRRPPGTALQRVAREVKWSRPSLVLFTVVAYVWAGGCLADALASLLALVRGGQSKASSTEALLITGVVVAVSLTPTVFWLRHLAKTVWRNSSRSLTAAALLRRVTLISMVLYAVAALSIRLVSELSPWQLPGGGEYQGILLSTASLVAGVAALIARGRGQAAG